MTEKQKNLNHQNKQQDKIFFLLKVAILILVLLLILFLLHQLTNGFQMIKVALSIVFPPVVVAVFLYYLLKPAVTYLEKKGLNRQVSIILVLLFIVLFIILAIAFFIPHLQEQVQQLIDRFPIYWESTLSFFENSQILDPLSDFLNRAFSNTDWQGLLKNQINRVVEASLGGLNNVFSAVFQAGIVIFTSPILLYFLLKDDRRMIQSFVKLFPKTWRKHVKPISYEASMQVSIFVRGQLLVALVVGLLFWIGFTIIGLDYALTLSLLAGLLNMVPYLGSIIATVPAIIIALIDSPFMLLKTILVFALEQFIEGRLVQPLILGNQLRVHPMTILFLLLVAGRLWGIGGLLLAIPVYVVIKVILTYLFDQYKMGSGDYENESS